MHVCSALHLLRLRKPNVFIVTSFVNGGPIATKSNIKRELEPEGTTTVADQGFWKGVQITVIAHFTLCQTVGYGSTLVLVRHITSIQSCEAVDYLCNF